MYTYEGHGYVIPGDIMGDIDDLVSFIRDATGDEALVDVYDVDDAGILGDYCSPDICDEATVNGYEVNREEGVFVVRREYDDACKLADTIIVSADYAGARDEYYGDFFVECNQ